MASLLIENILKTHKITDYLRSNGLVPDGPERSGKLFYKCPLHQGDNTPSFVVYTQSGEYENFYCFGCLREDQLIWTAGGLRQIGDVKRGDRVFDGRGILQTVLCTQHKQAETIGLTTAACKEPLWLTPDHQCIVIRKADAIKSMAGIYANKHSQRYGYFYQRSMIGRKKRYAGDLSFEVTDASTLSIGDLIGFPVFSERYACTLRSPQRWQPHSKGPVPRHVEFLPATEDAARLYGLYLAEGSISSRGRVVFFTFCMDEEQTLAVDTQRILQATFDLPSTLLKRPIHNTCDVICCSTKLAHHLGAVFGKGAANKRIPVDILRWPINLQKALMSGYQDGDGNGHGVSNTTSRELSLSLFALAIQCGYGPCRSVRGAYEGKDGTRHKESFSLNLKIGNRLSGFFETVEGVEFYFSPLHRIVAGDRANVVDISVENSGTFLTNLGAVHNCKARYNIIHLFRDLEKITLKQAIKALANGMKIDDDAEMAHAIQQIEGDGSVQAKFTPDELALVVSKQLYDFLEITEKDSKCVEEADRIGQLIDKAVDECDIEGLHRLYEILDDVLPKRVMLYQQEREQKITDGTNA